MAPKKKDTDDYLGLELDGKVWVVSKENGETTRTEIEAKVVLDILVETLTSAIYSYTNTKQPKKKK